MNIADVVVNQTTGMCLVRERIPAGIVGATVTVHFADPIWDGLEKKVVFRGDELSKIADKFDGTTAVIPAEVIAEPGTALFFGIWGYEPGGGLQLPLIEVRLGRTERATEPGSDPDADPDLPIWAQLKEDLDELREQVESGGTGTGGGISISVVAELPTEAISTNTVYMVKDAEADGNVYTEYLYVNDAWEIIGSQQLDLSGYVKSINGVKPDPLTGDVELDTGGNVDQGSGLTDEEKTLILTLFRNAAYTADDMADSLEQLETLWNVSGDDDTGGEDSGGDTGDDNTEEETHTHSYTSAVTTAATCTTNGVRTYTCSCGETYTETIAATGHNYVDGTCANCGAADPDTESGEEAEPLYTLENVDSYEVLDRWSANAAYITITDGNHVKIFGEGGSSSWYLDVNLSSLVTNGQNETALTTWFTIPANAEVEFTLSNIAYDGTNTGNHIIDIRDINDSALASVSLKDIASSTERTTTVTTTADVDIRNVNVSFMKYAGEYYEYDVKLYVDGVRWI